MLFSHLRPVFKTAATRQSHKEVSLKSRQRSFKTLFVEMPLFLPSSVDHVGPNKPWGDGSRVRKHSGAAPVVPSRGEEAHSALPWHEGNGASLKVSTCHVALGLGLYFQWSYSLTRVLMESSYSFFQVKINKKLTSLLCAYAATYKQTGYLHNCLKKINCAKEELLHPYHVCIYTHILIDNRKRNFLTNFTNHLVNYAF